MELFNLVLIIWLILLMTFLKCFDNRRPMSTKLINKYRVKDDSIFRKIIKFKDEKDHPCNYFVVVPFYVFLLISILGLILLLVNIFSGGLITKIVPGEVFTIIMLCIFGISMLYYLIITIWWEIVDYNELKFTIKGIKQIRKIVKEYKRKQKK